VVIDDRNRTASVGIYNKTANTGDYEITVADMLMTGTSAPRARPYA
jgi:hypothetical protein